MTPSAMQVQLEMIGSHLQRRRRFTASFSKLEIAPAWHRMKAWALDHHLAWAANGVDRSLALPPSGAGGRGIPDMPGNRGIHDRQRSKRCGPWGWKIHRRCWANHLLLASLMAYPRSLAGPDLIWVQHTLAPTPCLVQRVGLVPPPQLPLPQLPHLSPGPTCWVVSVTSHALTPSPNSWQRWRHCAAWRHHPRPLHRHDRRSCRSPSWRPR